MERELPDGWRMMTVAQVIENIPLTNIKLKQSDYQTAGKYPVIDQGQMLIGGYTNKGELKVPCELPVVIFGDHTKIVKYIDFEFVAGADGIKVMKPKDIINTKLFYHFAKSIKLPNKGYARHFKLLEESFIPIPPERIQHKIVAILSKAEETKGLRTQADELTGRLIQSVFLGMFGNPVKNPKKWRIVLFENTCQTRLGKMLDSKQQNGLNKRYYLRNTNVQWGRLDLSSVLQMDFDESEREEFRLKKGDVLICEGGRVGRSAIWNDELPECYFQKALHRVRPYLDMATPEYIANLMLALNDCGGLNSFTSEATIAHLTGIKLKGLPIPLPPLSLQTRFSEISNRMKMIILNQNNSRLELNGLFDVLTQKAFTGDLVA
jgi:type I restriction enzyme, S subunit